MFQDGMIVTRPTRDRLVPGPRGVQKIVPHKCQWGYTMFSTAFGDTEYLIDMNGMVVHQWPVTHSQYAQLLPNGNILAGNYGWGLKEVTPHGDVVWQYETDYHHDFDMIDDDTIALLVQGEKTPPEPGLFPDEFSAPMSQNHQVWCIDRKGGIQWKFVFKDHVDDLHRLAGLPRPIRFGQMDNNGVVTEYGKAGGWQHTNTLEVLKDNPAGRKDPRFRAGNILFSFRALDIIGIADIEKNEIVWAWGLGVLDGQHQPVMTDKGTILILDNGTARGYSAVVEVDPLTDKEVWRYEDRANFYSAYRAGVNRCANGNTLIAESDAGRLFEVTPEGEVVWEFLNPFFSNEPGSQGLHIYRATRLSEEQIEPIIAARADCKMTAVSNTDRQPLKTYREALTFYREGLGG